MRLESKIALVTGAGGGLGGATAIRFAAEGAKVVCSDLDLAKAEKTVSIIESKGGTAIAHRCDIADPAQCDAQVDETIKCFNQLNILVNSAGVSLHRLALDTTIEDWNRVLNINLTGSFLTSKAAANVMLKNGGGRIIQIGSISGQRGNMGGIAYGASKAAVMHICKVLATELSGQGIMVNAIAPGPIETGLSNHGPSRKQKYQERIPVGKYGSIDAVANAALFFASDECEWTTGTILNVDGGYGAQGVVYDPVEINH